MVVVDAPHAHGHLVVGVVGARVEEEDVAGPGLGANVLLVQVPMDKAGLDGPAVLDGAVEETRHLEGKEKSGSASQATWMKMAVVHSVVRVHAYDCLLCRVGCIASSSSGRCTPLRSLVKKDAQLLCQSARRGSLPS